MINPRRLRIAIAILASTALSACGGGDGEEASEDAQASEDEQAVLDAAEQTVAKGSARLVLVYTGDVTGRLEVDTDFKSDRSSGLLEADAVPGLPPGTRLPLYVDGPRTYTKARGRWIELPQDFGGTFGNQPSALLTGLATGLKDIHLSESGGSSLGISYQGTYDFKALAESLPPDERAAAEERLEPLGDRTEFPAKVVVAVDGTIRVLELEISSGGAIAHAEMTIEDLGEPVEIGPPPTDAIPADRLSVGA